MELRKDSSVRLVVKARYLPAAKLILEPWAEEFEMTQDDEFLFVLEGTNSGAGFSVELIRDSNALVVCNESCGTTVTVFRNGIALDTVSRKLPTLTLSRHTDASR